MRTHLALVAVPALLAGALLTGCSAQSSSGTTTSTAPAKTAESIAKALGEKVPSVQLTKVFTTDDDPNHLLGRPGGYLSKSAFTDTRVPAEQAPNEFSTERGGGVEVFGDAAAAKARMDKIQGIAKDMGGLISEYDYVNGTVLVRVSSLLTPEQAKEYESALAAIG